MLAKLWTLIIIHQWSSHDTVSASPAAAFSAPSSDFNLMDLEVLAQLYLSAHNDIDLKGPLSTRTLPPHRQHAYSPRPFPPVLETAHRLHALGVP